MQIRNVCLGGGGWTKLPVGGGKSLNERVIEAFIQLNHSVTKNASVAWRLRMRYTSASILVCETEQNSKYSV